MKNLTLISTLILLSYLTLTGQPRQDISFNTDWVFKGKSLSGLSKTEAITLPHTWNSQDAQKGIPFYRGVCEYTKTFLAQANWKNKRVFIHFEGVNITAKVQLNGKDVGEHKGGYAAFVFELTPFLNFDKENNLKVTVSNELNKVVIPLVGDFNNYGGIYRPVRLVVTQAVCISPLDYGSPGIYVKQQNVSEKQADIEVLTKISNATNKPANLTYETTVLAANGTVVSKNVTNQTVAAGNSEVSHRYQIQNPHLWNGKKDPYLYQVQVVIRQNGSVVDTKTEPLGLRYFKIDANKGFFLNGQAIALRGVSRHQDRLDKGSAISDADHQEDMSLMLEMGINALRLAHYQHAEKIYDIADSSGLIVWAELPFVGMPSAAGGVSNGYENTPEFHENAKQQLHELIRQNFNHPSILMWSIFNEIQNPESASPLEFVKELNKIVKTDDPSRLSVGAHMIDPFKNPKMNEVTDMIAYNRYFGWYYAECKDMGVFLDKVHAQYPNLNIGVSEYGAGGALSQHSDVLSVPNPMGSPHPEEWQSYYHEENLKIFDARPYVWGTFLWNMFDFGSFFRKEGDEAGQNDKGMITFDRKTKKDAFYFYKANWSQEPVLHITSSRYVFRKQAATRVKVYTNLQNVILTVNGKEFPAKSPEKGIIVWDNITLSEGTNGVIVQATKDGKTYTDECVWMRENPYKGLNLFRTIFEFLMVAWYWIGAGVLATAFVWFKGIRNRKNAPKWQRILLWTLFIVLLLVTLLMLFAKLYIPSMLGG